MLVDTAVDGEAMGATAEAAALQPAGLAETIGDMEAATTPTGGQEGMAGTAREAAGAGMGAARASAAAREDSAVRPEGAEELPEGGDEVRTGKSPTKMLWERDCGEAPKCIDEPHPH